MLGDLFKKEYAGLYFGSKGISFLQMSSGRVKSWLAQAYPVPADGGLHPGAEDIFEVFKDREMELIAFLQKGIRESNLEAKNITVSLPPKDLIIRFFEMPNIPHNEIAAGINFEIKKYIPFKIEELAFDYQHKIKPKAKIIEVILCGMKQAPLDSYSNLLGQVSLTASVCEPGLFSLFRFLIVKGKISNQKSYVILEFGQEGANILITEKGFPYFTRDIRLVSAGGQQSAAEDREAQMFRLVNEVRVSLDYYRRQFLKKEVDEMIVISPSATSGLADHFSKELGLKVNLLNLAELIPEATENKEMLSDLAKAYGAALRQERPTLITLNLLRQKEKARSGSTAMGTASDNVQQSISDFIIENKPSIVKGGIAGLLVLVLGYGFGFSRLFPLEREKALATVQTPPLLSGIDLTSLEGVQASETQYITKQRDLQGLISTEVALHKKLLAISELIPPGVWVSGLSFIKDGQLVLSCRSYAADASERQKKMNDFVAFLREDPDFSKSFVSIQLHSYSDDYEAVFPQIHFDVSCTSKAK